MLPSYKPISIGNIAGSIPLRKVDTVLLQKEKYKKKNHFSNTIGAKKCCESFVLLLSNRLLLWRIVSFLQNTHSLLIWILFISLFLRDITVELRNGHPFAFTTVDENYDAAYPFLQRRSLVRTKEASRIRGETSSRNLTPSRCPQCDYFWIVTIACRETRKEELGSLYMRKMIEK